MMSVTLPPPPPRCTANEFVSQYLTLSKLKGLAYDRQDIPYYIRHWGRQVALHTLYYLTEYPTAEGKLPQALLKRFAQQLLTYRKSVDWHGFVCMGNVHHKSINVRLALFMQVVKASCSHPCYGSAVPYIGISNNDQFTLTNASHGPYGVYNLPELRPAMLLGAKTAEGTVMNSLSTLFSGLEGLPLHVEEAEE
jgi:hypothetical protein